MKSNRNTLILAIILVSVAALMRIVSTESAWYNFAPFVAISIFSGAIFKRSPLAFILPLTACLISDIYLQTVHHNGFYGISQLFVYGAMAVIVLFGSFMKKRNALNVLGFSVGGTLLFWLISNFGVFVDGRLWGTGMAGFTKTYLMAIPFYKNEFATNLFVNAMLGDIIYSGALFGIYGMLARPSLVSQAFAK